MAITYGNVPQFGFIDRYIAEKREGFGWDNLGRRRPLWVTLHRMVGNLWGTDGYFRDPTVSSITDYGIGIAAVSGEKNAGVILRWNDPYGVRSGWASGPVSAPYGDGLKAVQKYGINGVNRFGVSIEGDGTDQPFDAFAWGELVHFIAYWADQAKVPYTSFPLNPETGFSFVIFHEEFTYGTGKRCPFPWLKAAVQRLIDDVQAFLMKYQAIETTGGIVEKPTPIPATTPIGSVARQTVRTIKNVLAREAPSTAARVVMDLPAGMVGTVEEAGTQVGNGIVWFNFRGPGGTGWVPVGDVEAYTPVVVEPPKMWTSPSPIRELAEADPDTVGDLVLADGVKFQPVFDTFECVRQTPQKRYAIDGPVSEGNKVIGPDLKPGDQIVGSFRFENQQGTEYLYTVNHARVLYADMKRVKD